MSATVSGLHLSSSHSFSKESRDEVTLIEGVGVEGDAHAGETVKHRSRVRYDPTQPNLRQVHLLHSEVFTELAEKGFQVGPGDIGENVTTEGIELLSLPRDTILWLGDTAAVRITGLRNPCVQLDRYQEGLMNGLLDKDSNGALIRKAGIMSVVLYGGIVRVGDEIRIELPEEPHFALERV
jgi:MOSC domain-containing protein YiiM